MSETVSAFEGFEFARERLSQRARSKQKSLQHIVASRVEELSEDGKRLAPWQYRVVSRCKAKLRRAAVKIGRQFLELELCPKCRKTLPPDK